MEDNPKNNYQNSITMNRFYFTLFCIALALTLSSCGNKKKKITGTVGTVKEVVNGNTVRLASGLKVTLLGIENGARSKEYMEKNLLNKKIRLKTDSQDKLQYYRSNKETVRAYVNVIRERLPLNGFLIRNRIAKANMQYVTDSMQWKKIPHPQKELTTQQIASLGRPATFLIQTTSGYGTGFFINRKGLALTNNHVYNGEEDAIIYLFDIDGNLIPDAYRKISRVLFTNTREEFDFTIFQVDVENEDVPFLALSFGEPNVGDEITTIGNPMTLQKIASNTNTLSSVFTGKITNIDQNGFIYHDANIDHGNSGGPVINKFGEVLSIVTNAGGGIAYRENETIKGNQNWGVDIRIIRSVLDKLGKDYAGK